MSSSSSTTRFAGGAAGWAGLASRGLPHLLLGLVVARFLWESWELRPQIDDAYISYRYARNLVEGHGLVFNVGEYVEGFTNLLWTLLIAVGIGLGLEAPVAAHALGLASGTALLVVSFAYTRCFVPDARAWAAATTPALLLSTTSFGLWATSGLETPLFAALVTGTLLAAARERMGLATLCAVLATLTRPDGVLAAAAVYGVHLAGSWRSGWRCWRWPVCYGAAMLALTLFRLAYYGSPIPNTFYAKVGGIPIWPGVVQTVDFLRAGNGYLLIPFAFGLVGDRRVLPAAVLVPLFTAYIIYVGGDNFPHHRFFLAVLPCMAALAVRGASTGYDRNRYLGVALAWLIGLAIVLNPHGRALEIEQNLREFHASEARGRRRGELLASQRPAVDLVACMGIGSFGYYSGLPILDLFGLTDPTIARSLPDRTEGAVLLPGHARSNADYVLSREPDVIIMNDPDKLALPSSRELWDHPLFQAHYRYDEALRGFRRSR